MPTLRIWRRDDGAQGHRRRQWNLGKQPGDHKADGDGAEDDVADRQQADGAAVGADIEQRGLQGRRVEQRRQQPDQHELRV
jgi:hypothetical protein